jgi:hypothetical protein
MSEQDPDMDLQEIEDTIRRANLGREPLSKNDDVLHLLISIVNMSDHTEIPNFYLRFTSCAVALYRGYPESVDVFFNLSFYSVLLAALRYPVPDVVKNALTLVLLMCQKRSIAVLCDLGILEVIRHLQSPDYQIRKVVLDILAVVIEGDNYEPFTQVYHVLLYPFFNPETDYDNSTLCTLAKYIRRIIPSVGIGFLTYDIIYRFATACRNDRFKNCLMEMINLLGAYIGIFTDAVVNAIPLQFFEDLLFSPAGWNKKLQSIVLSVLSYYRDSEVSPDIYNRVFYLLNRLLIQRPLAICEIIDMLDDYTQEEKLPADENEILLTRLLSVASHSAALPWVQDLFLTYLSAGTPYFLTAQRILTSRVMQAMATVPFSRETEMGWKHKVATKYQATVGSTLEDPRIQELTASFRNLGLAYASDRGIQQSELFEYTVCIDGFPRHVVPKCKSFSRTVKTSIKIIFPDGLTLSLPLHEKIFRLRFLYYHLTVALIPISLVNYNDQSYAEMVANINRSPASPIISMMAEVSPPPELRACPHKFYYLQGERLVELSDEICIGELFFRAPLSINLTIISRADNVTKFLVPYYPFSSPTAVLTPYSTPFFHLVDPPVDTTLYDTQLMIRYSYPTESLFPSNTRVFVLTNSRWFGYHVRLYTANMYLLPLQCKVEIYEGEFHKKIDIPVPNTVRVPVRRDHVLEDGKLALRNFGISSTLIKFYFHGELGLGKGPTCEFLVSFSDALSRSIFNDDPCSRIFGTYASDENISLIAILLARAFIAGTNINLHLSKHFFDLMRERPNEFTGASAALQRLNAIDPEQFIILTTSQLIGMPFEHSVFTFPTGERIINTEADRDEFITLVASCICGDKYRERVRPIFIHAFGSVFSRYGDSAYQHLADLLSNDELVILLDGTVIMTTEDVERGIIAGEGYSEVSQQIVQLRNLLGNMNREQQMKFLRFVTAREVLPAGGLRALNPPLTVIPFVVDSPDSHLPTSRTCHHVLSLPRYSTAEILETKVRAILDVNDFGIV